MEPIWPPKGPTEAFCLGATAAVSDPESPHSYAAQCGLCGVLVRQDFEAETSKLGVVGKVRLVDFVSFEV